MAKFSLVLLASVIATSAFAGSNDLPPYSKVEGVVQRHFATLPGHQSGDLISRTQVQPIFRTLDRLGWNVADEAAIVNDTLSDSNYLVQEFRTTKGSEFMRKVSGSPLAYDRLDQIARLPGGKLMVKDFLRFPNSELTFAENAPLDVSRLARLEPRNKRSGIPTEADLNKPTGRIYTVQDLLARLRKSYDVEVQRREELRR